MASKQVTDREKSTRAVGAAVDTHSGDLARHIADTLSPYLAKGETLPDVALIARLVGRWMHRTTERLVQADRAHEDELGDDAAPREARDRAAEKVRAVLVDLRGALDSTHGPSALALMHVQEAAPSDPSVIATQGRTVLEALSNDKLKLPAPRRAGVKIERAAFADDLARELPELEKALNVVSREAREAEATLRAKQSAMEASDHAFTNGAAWLSATFALAGMNDLAAKVRPSGRKPGQTAETPEPAGGAPPFGGPAPS